MLDHMWDLLVGVGIIIIVWLAFFIILRRFASQGKFQKFGILTTYLVVITIFFVLSEFYLSSKGFFQHYSRTYPGQYQNDPDAAPYAQVDPNLGWISRRTSSEINPQGFRDRKDFHAIAFEPNIKRIMILGDSFMWGAGVSTHEVVANLLQAKLENEYECFNLSVPGWGIDQMYLAYQQYKHLIEPDIVILAFIHDDINRVLEAYRMPERMNKPSFTVENDSLMARTAISERALFLNKMMKKSILFSLLMRQLYIMTDANAIVKHIFLNMERELRQQKKRFTIVRIPTHADKKLIVRLNHYLFNFADHLEENKVLYLDPLDEIKQIPGWEVDFYLRDGHMSAAGNRFLAGYIYKHAFEN